MRIKKQNLTLVVLGTILLTAACSDAEFGNGLNKGGNASASSNNIEKGSDADANSTGNGNDTLSDLGVINSLDDSGILSPSARDDLSSIVGEDLSKDGSSILWATCSPEKGASYKDMAYGGKNGEKFRVFGEFCPTLNPAVTVLFVVDFSGSMIGNSSEAANDPTVNRRCGRLDGAQAVVDELKVKEQAGAKVNVGMLRFSVASATRMGLPIGSVSALEANLNEQTFCGAENPNANTNYKAAFEAAYNVLEKVEGLKVVYFISDGFPTEGGSFVVNHADAGLQAALKLRSLKNLDLQAVYLGYKGSGANNPQSYLAQITGDAARVTLVANANQLAGALKSIASTQIQLQQANAKASFTALNTKKDLTVPTFKSSPDKAGIWIYGTSPFELAGKPGEVVKNVVTVTITSSAGAQTLESHIGIDFTAQ